MKNIIRIVAAVVDTRHLTLYDEKGETVLIPQGDIRVRRVLDEATPQLISHGYADVDIAPETDNTYLEFEEQSNGVVKLFRIAKSKLAALLAVVGEEVEQVTPITPTTIGKVPEGIQKTLNAVEEIMQHAVPVSSPQFHEEGIHQQGNIVEEDGDTIRKPTESAAADTIIAVTDGKIIPGMENIKTQFARAAKLGSTKGVEAFLKRLGSVIEQRKHSVEDLLKFMERGDLPIADDGSILIYKVLTRKDKVYVDCHTLKVEQWVGAYVCMDASLVDHNRRNECSNGLHVARRGYVSGFSGNVCVLAKLAPEDVIAVPEYDANKMRVCGYHIIAELSDAQYQLVKANKPISDDPAGKVLLGKALAGEHIGKTHSVEITQQQGNGVKITEHLGEVKNPKTEAKKGIPVAEALSNPDAETKDEPIDPKAVVKSVEQLSRKDQAAKLYAEGRFTELRAMKKAAKVSWEKLGVPDPGNAEDTTVAQAVPTSESEVAKLVQATHGEGSARERIKKLLAVGLISAGVAQAILDLKKQSKKSWSYLEVSEGEVGQITKLTTVK